MSLWGPLSFKATQMPKGRIKHRKESIICDHLKKPIYLKGSITLRIFTIPQNFLRGFGNQSQFTVTASSGKRIDKSFPAMGSSITKAN